VGRSHDLSSVVYLRSISVVVVSTYKSGQPSNLIVCPLSLLLFCVSLFCLFSLLSGLFKELIFIIFMYENLRVVSFGPEKRGH